MNLTALQHSAFLQSLGWAIANSLWQAAVLWVIYYLVNGLYKNSSAKFKNNFSAALLMCAFAWFCITLSLKYFSLQNSFRVNTDLPYTIVAHPAIISSNNSWNIFLNKVSQTLPYLSVAYLLLLILFSAKLINSYRFTYFIKTNGLQKPGVEWKLFAQKVAMHLGITKKIKLWISAHVDVPATIGFLKPVILIPLASINQLSAEQLEAIILHELSHIKRNDYLLNLFISLIETILFFNPFIILLGKIIKQERENCCDDFVIQYQYDRHSYASALFSLEQSRKTNLRFALTATSGKHQLLTRIQRIMEVKKVNVNFNYGQKLLALLLVTTIICSIAWLSPEKDEKNISPVINQTNKVKDIAKALPLINKKNKLHTTIVSTQPKKLPVIIKPYAKHTDLKSNKVNDEKDVAEEIAPEKFYQNITVVNEPAAALAFNDATPLYSRSPVARQPAINNIINKKAQLEKLRAEIEKERSHFNFRFNDNELQNHLRDNLKNIQQQSSVQNFQYYYYDELQKVIDGTLKTYSEGKLKQQENLYVRRMQQPKVNYDQPFYTDSVAHSRVVILNRRNRIAPVANTEVKNLSGEKNIKIKSPVFTFHMNLADDLRDDKKNGKMKAAQDQLNIELKNGVLVINGEKINMPDSRKMLALLKAQKLIPAVDKNVVDYETDN